MITFFRNLSIRFKLLGGSTLIFILATLLGEAVIYYTVRSTIEANIERELTNSTATILNMVQTAAGTSIKNYLRTIAEKNKDIIQHIYADFQNGLIGEKDAKANKINMILTDNNEKITLTIKDNGKGLNNNTQSMGMGIRIMKYRAARIGASFDILEDSEKGTLVVIELDKRL